MCQLLVPFTAQKKTSKEVHREEEEDLTLKLVEKAESVERNGAAETVE